MKRPYFWIFLCSLFMFSWTGCDKDDKDDAPKAVRTVLAYIIGDNSLSRYAEPNIEAMMEGLAVGNEQHINLLVYQDNHSDPPTLWKLEKRGPNVEKKMIKQYEEQNSVDKALMSSIISDVFLRYPADEKGLILWSHGSGWLPSSNYGKAKALTSGPHRAFGQDGSDWLELWDIRTVLASTGMHFNFILFDACHMANVEVAYELRECTDYLIASSAEIMGDGFPYNTLIALMNRPELDVHQLGKAYMEYYNGANDYMGGTISVIKTQRLPELAQLYANVLMSSKATAEELKEAKIQEFGRRVASSTTYRNCFFDLRETVGVISSTHINPLSILLEDIVLFEGHTPTFGFTSEGGEKFKINTSCGLTVFIPELNSSELYHSAYQNSQWYKAVY